MSLNDLNIFQKSHYYKDSDIFNLKPPKTPDKYKTKRISLKLDDNDNNEYNNRYNNFENIKYYRNKKDHINECLRDKNFMENYTDKYKMYKTVDNLRKESRKIYLDKSYDFNYDENNKIYKNIRLFHKKGNVSLGNAINNFSSEYNSMQDYAKKVMLRKKVEKEKQYRTNKSMDIPFKFKPTARQNFKRKSHMNELFTPNTIAIDLSKSNDNLQFNDQKNNLDFYKSNIFFDKQKEKKKKKISS